MRHYTDFPRDDYFLVINSKKEYNRYRQAGMLFSMWPKAAVSWEEHKQMTQEWYKKMDYDCQG